MSAQLRAVGTTAAERSRCQGEVAEALASSLPVSVCDLTVCIRPSLLEFSEDVLSERSTLTQKPAHFIPSFFLLFLPFFKHRDLQSFFVNQFHVQL